MFSSTQRVKRLQSLIEKDGFNQGAHFMLGEEYMREGRHMAAAAKFRRVVEINPDHARAWMLMGQAYEGTGVMKEAVIAYEEAALQFENQQKPVDAEAMRAAAAEARKTLN